MLYSHQTCQNLQSLIRCGLVVKERELLEFIQNKQPVYSSGAVHLLPCQGTLMLHLNLFCELLLNMHPAYPDLQYITRQTERINSQVFIFTQDERSKLEGVSKKLLRTA